MPEVLTTEFKSDLERIYKITGDLLNRIEVRSNDEEHEAGRELLELVRFKLMDIAGTLQKDIFNCDYLVTKIRTAGGDGIDRQERPSGRHWQKA